MRIGFSAIVREIYFRLVYVILKAEFEDGMKASQQIYLIVVFMAFHRAIFRHRIRPAMSAAYEEKFNEIEEADGQPEPVAHVETRPRASNPAC